MTPVAVRDSSRLLVLGVALILGLSFTVTLFLLAWQSALDGERQEFAFSSLGVVDTVSRGVTAAEDVISNIAAVYNSFPEVDEVQMRRLSEAMLERHGAIAAVAYHAAVEGEAGEPGRRQFRLRHEITRSGDPMLETDMDLAEDWLVRQVIQTAINTGATVPSPPLSLRSADTVYMLLRAVYEPAPQAAGGARGPLKGIVSLAIDPSQLFSQAAVRPDMAVNLLTESEGISGRQVVYDRLPGDAGGPWVVSSLSEGTTVRFPHYSVKLTIGRDVRLGDLNHGLTLTALVLGAGITLLMVALASAKEQQARQLRERNAVIERKVEEQTRELALARDQALEASRVKSDFLASMSHEIRTPLNAIIGMAELLSETRLSSEQDRYVQVFRKAGEALLSLVNDILDLSKIEADQLVLEEIPFDIREVCEEAVEIYALKTDEKGIELVCQVAEDVPQRLVGDPSRLRQIILNLIGNAIKFTEQGEIAVRVSLDPQGGDPGALQFAVSDTGIGIPKNKLESIFQSFTQVDSSTTRKYGGTGLGLTISRKLVDLMGGRIWVESEVGEGSTFLFQARFAIAPEQGTVRPPVAVSLRGRRVLVVDDNETNRLILHQALSAEGALITEARNGEQGLAAYREARTQGRGYDLVLLDCRMPGMDGFEVAEAIKAEGGDVNAVMMLTSANLSSYVTRAREIGLSAYLVKPIKRGELLKAIGAALAARTAPAAVAGQGAAREAAPEEEAARILLVEDNADNRLLIQAYLKKSPYRVDEAENGAVAVEKVKNGPYDLVLMDVQMPVMDGHTATRSIREWEQAQGRAPVPIIALTAHAIKEDMEKSLAAGCTAHLTKPIKKTTLLEAIQRHLSS